VAASNVLVHLAPCDIQVSFDSQDYTISAMNAHVWCQLLLDDPFDPYNVFPGLAGEAAVVAVEDALGDKRMETEDVARVALEIVTIAGDRPWWVTIRILYVAGEVWDRIGGTLVREGVDSRQLPLAAWLDAVWSILLAYVDPKKMAAWLHQIEATPKGWESAIDFDEQEQAFMAAMKSVM
jgi:hypothetical protein